MILDRNTIHQMIYNSGDFFLPPFIKNILDKGSIWGDVISHVVLDQQTAFCIETELDLVIAESLLAINQNSDV